MNAILSLPLENPVSFYLLNVSLSVTVLAGLGLLTARLLIARPAPLRHGFLIATLLLVFLSPLLVVLSLHWNLGVFSLPGVPQPPLERIVYESEAAAPPNFCCPSAELTKETTLAPRTDLPAWCWVWRWLGISFLALWAVGIAWQSVVLSRGLWLVRCLRRSLRGADGARWSFLTAKASQAVGLRRPAEVAVSDVVSSPVSLGILHPIIVIPASVEGVLREEEMEGILLHEVAHIAQRDHLIGLLQRLIKVVFWWHPLVRMFCGALDEIKEELCDNYVVLSQGSGVPFARCLVRLAELTLCRKALPTALGVLGGRQHLEHRVTNLLRKKRQVMTRMTRRMALAVTLFVLAAGSLMAASTVKVVPPILDTEGIQEKQMLARGKKDGLRWIELLVSDLKKALISDISSIWLEDKSSNIKMKITHDPQGNLSIEIAKPIKDSLDIAMTVTKTKEGKEVKKEYKAKDAKEFEKKYPEAHEIYKTIIISKTIIEVLINIKQQKWLDRKLSSHGKITSLFGTFA